MGSILAPLLATPPYQRCSESRKEVSSRTYLQRRSERPLAATHSIDTWLLPNPSRRRPRRLIRPLQALRRPTQSAISNQQSRPSVGPRLHAHASSHASLRPPELAQLAQDGVRLRLGRRRGALRIDRQLCECGPEGQLGQRGYRERLDRLARSAGLTEDGCEQAREIGLGDAAVGEVARGEDRSTLRLLVTQPAASTEEGLAVGGWRGKDGGVTPGAHDAVGFRGYG
jgi:hypothetical protein